MRFIYTVLTQESEQKSGTIDAINEDVAIASLQRRGYIVVSLKEGDEGTFFQKEFTFFGGVSNKDIVILSRQIATLFEAQVSALRAFRLLASESGNRILMRVLTEVADDIQTGVSMSHALSRHPKVFSIFYVNMVKAGEESGKLTETFLYLADYLDRSYELTSKTKNALIYPAFVVATFAIVMVLMLTLVIPRLSAILLETGQEIPVYTKIVVAISNLLTQYGLFFLVLLIIGGFFLWQFSRSEKGRIILAQSRLNTPYIGELYQKLYLSRIADNMHTMLSSGISIVRAIEITSNVVGNDVYKNILVDVGERVKSGSSFSNSLEGHPEIPSILTQMVKIGEETGEMGNILKTLARFYKREVDNSVDTLVGLIEPVMIVALGLGVGILLTSVLVPIYNITANI
ncbi:MAG: type II secretion system F family protein [Patescibacteria group bacterium]|nr:type II secretion system F family protein [Patescibacteria group bacterium]